MKIPDRFSPEWWLCLLAVGVLAGAVIYGLLFALGLGHGPLTVLWVLAGALAVDVLTAALLEYRAPTGITLRPGERWATARSAEIQAELLSGFEDSDRGEVLVRGERWSARLEDRGPDELAPGTLLSVVDREGLTLIVRPNR